MSIRSNLLWIGYTKVDMFLQYTYIYILVRAISSYMPFLATLNLPVRLMLAIVHKRVPTVLWWPYNLSKHWEFVLQFQLNVLNRKYAVK